MAGTCVWACVSDRAARETEIARECVVPIIGVIVGGRRRSAEWSTQREYVFILVVVVVDCWLTVGEASDDAWQYTEKFNVNK